MSSADLVREVKYRAKIDRDVELAEKVNVGKANVSSWLKRGTKPDAIALLDLMILGNLDAKETKRILQGGFSSLSLLLMTSFGSTLALAWIHFSDMLYIMLNRNVFKKAAFAD